MRAGDLRARSSASPSPYSVRQGHEGVGLGYVDPLALAGLVSVAEGGEDAEGAEEAGDGVAGASGEAGGLHGCLAVGASLFAAVEPHPAAHGLGDDVEGGSFDVGAGLAEA